jgi:hypothetical protein
MQNKWRPDQFEPPLTDVELQNAVSSLNNSSLVDKFPKLDRVYADPAISLQNFSLFSFMPAKGATPNASGLFGFAKIRGCFATELEANQRAEFLIRNVDSYNQIFHTYCGRPFPVTLDSKYSADINEVDLKKDMAKTVSENIKEKKADDQKIMQELKQKEEALLEDSKREEVDPYDEYITLKVKKAQLSWTYLEHIKKMNEIKEIIIKSRKKLEELDQQNSEFAKLYLAKYNKARENAGIDTSDPSNNDNFMKFMVEDAILPGIDSVLNINP